MLFLLDNGAHSIKAGHDHEPRYFHILFQEKQNKYIRTPPACSKTRSSAQRATSSPTTVTRSRSAGTARLSSTGSPAKRSSAHKDIIPVPPAHPRQGICRRLGCTKGNLGWNVPSIPKGSFLLLATGAPFPTRSVSGGHPGILYSDNRTLFQSAANPAHLRSVRL